MAAAAAWEVAAREAAAWAAAPTAAVALVEA
jgi:hypothetical protein